MIKPKDYAAGPGGLLVLLAIVSAAARAGTPVSFTGSSGGNWSVAGNWSPAVSPLTAEYDVSLTGKYVYFDVAGTTTISSLALSSLSTVSLSAGCNLAVLNDAAMNRSSVVAAASFSSPSTNIDACSLNAGPGPISLGALTAYNSGAGNPQWQASGAGARVDVPALGAVTIPGFLYFIAGSGGDIEAPSLGAVSITGTGQLILSSTGASSMVNVSGLPKSLTQLKVTAGTGGTVNWGSPTAVTNSDLSMAGGVLNTSSLTSIDGTNLTASGGATFSLPVTSYSTVNTSWTASGAGSKLLLPLLTGVTFTAVPPNNNYLYLTASTGGDIELPALSSVTIPAAGGLVISSTGANSLVDLPALLSTTGWSGGMITLGGGGEVILGAPGGGDVAISFLAKFTNATGSLEILEDGQVAETILPNNLNAWQTYQFNLPPGSSIAVVTTGSSSSVTLASYQATPEPASLAMLALGANVLLWRRGSRVCRSAGVRTRS